MYYVPQINKLNNITGYRIVVDSFIDLKNPVIYSKIDALSQCCNLTFESKEHLDSTRLKSALTSILPQGCLISIGEKEVSMCGRQMIEEINLHTRRLVYKKSEDDEEIIPGFRAVVSGKKEPGFISISPVFRENVFDSGFSLIESWGFTNPGKDPVGPNQKTIINLINLLKQEEGLKHIELEIKKNPIISAKLFEYINSPAFGLNVEIKSFSHALSILGRANVTKWLCVLLSSSSAHPHADAILRTSIVRAYFMESMAKKFVEKDELDNVFITGSFSMLDRLFSGSMQNILEGIAISEDVKESLTFNGCYAPFLEFACSMEEGVESEKGDLIELDQTKKMITLIDSIQFSRSI